MFFPDVDDILIKNTNTGGIDFVFKDGRHEITEDGRAKEITGIAALKNWILKVVVTQVNAYEVYYKDENGVFGVGIYERLGTKERGYFLSEMKRDITEQLLENNEIAEVREFEIQIEKRSCVVRFTVVTSEGVQEEFNEDVYLWDYNTGEPKEPSEAFMPAPREDEFLEKLITNISDHVLLPNVEEEAGGGYEWKEGRSESGAAIRTFRDVKRVYHKEFADIEGNEIKLMTQELCEPLDSDDVTESETGLVSVNGKQLYFVSLKDMSAGYTYVSPRYYNPQISKYEEDMYKCRCLKTAGEAETVINISASSTNGEKIAEIVFDTAAGEYGFKFKENSNGVKVYKKYAGAEFEDVIFKVYATEEEAEADAENMPEGSVAVIKGR